ncbi:MAG TPA: hypothetical protein VKI00_08190, partial [Mycobacterium sp.]|uniref:hypothetical protein n=1 Tax=Mycobacterium sp. TaxID=1785 RepID=UPI002BBDDEF4
GTVPVDVAGALMRVTWYPTTAQQPIYRKACDGWDWRQPWCQIAGALADLGGPTDSDYRVNPTPGEDAQLSYAGYYMSGFGGILTPGETDTVEREVDIPGGFRVARLSASGIFFNQRRIKEIRPCSDDLPDDSTQQAIPSQAEGHFLCIDYEIAPANVLDELVAARQVVRVWVITDAQESAEQGNEYPRIDSTVGTAWDMSKKKGPSEVEEFEEANPMGSYTDVSAEYAPTDVTPSSGKK